MMTSPTMTTRWHAILIHTLHAVFTCVLVHVDFTHFLQGSFNGTGVVMAIAPVPTKQMDNGNTSSQQTKNVIDV